MRIKCIISYNGANYYGFQTQNKADMNSIQDEIEKVYLKFLIEKLIFKHLEELIEAFML